jgi:SAM-dependent methyltransferase
MTIKNDYVDVIYNESDRPFTTYPDKLTHHLVRRFGISKGQRLLDVGCGRGEFLRGVMNQGVEGYGADRSPAAVAICPNAKLCNADIEKNGLPFKDDFFDIVFSKSVIEHFYYPETLIQEIFRVLKPGGLIITMCPDWEFNIRVYFEDYTHRTPFMISSLRDIQRIHGFQDIRCERFRQLPFLWKMPWLLPITELVRVFTPSFLRKYSKLVRFSKEIMLLSSATKPETFAKGISK